MIVELLTTERLRSYFAATNGEVTDVMRLYEWNTEAAAAVISLISMTEVIVRNALDSALISWSRRRHPGISWLDAAPLDARGRADVAHARERATQRRPHGVHGKVQGDCRTSVRLLAISDGISILDNTVDPDASSRIPARTPRSWSTAEARRTAHAASVVRAQPGRSSRTDPPAQSRAGR